MRRCGSRVAASDITTKVTCPGARRLAPCDRERIRHFGGKMLDTRTRLQAAMPAERSASSNDVSFSRCLPTPLVKNISFGTNPTTSRLLGCATLLVKAAEQEEKLHGKRGLHCSQGSTLDSAVANRATRRPPARLERRHSTVIA